MKIKNIEDLLEFSKKDDCSHLIPNFLAILCCENCTEYDECSVRIFEDVEFCSNFELFNGE